MRKPFRRRRSKMSAFLTHSTVCTWLHSSQQRYALERERARERRAARVRARNRHTCTRTNARALEKVRRKRDAKARAEFFGNGRFDGTKKGSYAPQASRHPGLLRSFITFLSSGRDYLSALARESETLIYIFWRRATRPGEAWPRINLTQ